MNQKNFDSYSLKDKKLPLHQTNNKLRLGRWFKFSQVNKLTVTAFMLTVTLTFFSSAWLHSGTSLSYGTKNINQELIMAQEESEEREATEEVEEATEEVESEATEATEEVEEVTEEVESEATEAIEEVEEVTEEVESEATEATEEVESEATEAIEEAESEAEEATEEAESEAEEAEPRSREERAFEKTKESLEEEIDERYEEWESAKKSNELFRSISAIATILMTTFITVLGMEILQIPYRRTIILVLGIIAVFIQLNTNVFLLDKSLAGYEILKEQSLILKNKLEEVETEEELTEIREQFQELVLESIAIE